MNCQQADALNPARASRLAIGYHRRGVSDPFRFGNLIVLQKLLTSMEKRVYGPDKFLVEARATRALLKFCVDHKNPDPSVSDVRACLAALEVGEKSNAVAAFKRVRMGKEGFDEWWPHASSAAESDEHAWATFEALVERWYRLMKALAD